MSQLRQMGRGAAIVCTVGLVAWAASVARAGGQSTVPELIQEVSLDNLQATIGALQAPGGENSRVTFTAGNDSARRAIYGAFSALEQLSSVAYDTFFIPASVPFEAIPQYNVVATLTGSTFPDRILVLGAHYDCSASRMGSSLWNNQWQTIRAPGADDNATGVAVLLEMARILSDPSSGFDNAYTLKFVAFASEESGPAHSGGHGGSRHFAAQAKAEGADIVGMVSIDMIGYNPSHYFLAVVADARSQWLGGNLLAARDELGLDLLTNSAPFPSATYSDHASFWEQGYSAILLIENAPPWDNSTYYTANPYYHTSSDTMGTVNLELVRRVAQVTLATAIRLTGTVTGVEAEPGPLTLLTDTPSLETYPNPFNPQTTVHFSLARSEVIRLSVFDGLGRELLTLADGQWKEGEHAVSFSAPASLASGVYLCRLATPSGVVTRRMLLLR